MTAPAAGEGARITQRGTAFDDRAAGADRDGGESVAGELQSGAGIDDSAGGGAAGIGAAGRHGLFAVDFQDALTAVPTLSALISRCEAPLLNFDWQVCIKEVLPGGKCWGKAESRKH